MWVPENISKPHLCFICNIQCIILILYTVISIAMIWLVTVYHLQMLWAKVFQLPSISRTSLIFFFWTSLILYKALQYCQSWGIWVTLKCVYFIIYLVHCRTCQQWLFFVFTEVEQDRPYFAVSESVWRQKFRCCWEQWKVTRQKKRC